MPTFNLDSISDHPLARTILVWSTLDLFLLSSGIVTVVASICLHRAKQVIIHLILDNFHFICGLVLGAAYLLIGSLAVPAIWMGRERLWSLKALNWGIVVLIIATLLLDLVLLPKTASGIMRYLGISTFKYPTNDPRSVVVGIGKTDLKPRPVGCTDDTRNGTIEGKFETTLGFCSDPVFAASQVGCMSTITSSHAPGTDYTLNNIFTCLYGWIAILATFLLATLCVIKEVEVRFARIDEKRGGGGFV